MSCCVDAANVVLGCRVSQGHCGRYQRNRTWSGAYTILKGCGIVHCLGTEAYTIDVINDSLHTNEHGNIPNAPRNQID